MKIYLLFATIIYLFIPSVSLAGSDSLVNINDIKFNYDFEKSAFRKVNEGGKPDVIDLFMANYNNDTSFNYSVIHKKIEDCVHHLEQQIAGKSDSKKVKIIYDYIHKTFFKVYNDENSFSDIFKNGEYNCVSASALYALVFDGLGIPYQIKETPSHVYLEVYPYTSKILLETTAAEKGIMKFNDEFAREYVQSLYKSKIIGKTELDTSTTTELFNKYFFSSDNISLTQLAGLQYSNYGVYYLMKKEYENSIPNFIKAFFLYPSDRQRYFLMNNLILLLSKNDYVSMEHVKYLAILCRFNNEGDADISNSVIEEEFNRVINDFLIKRSEYQKLDSAFSIITSSVKDSSLRNDISFNYHYEYSRIGLVGLTDSASELRHLRAAYLINPKNADLQGFVITYFRQLGEKSDDPEYILKLMNNLNSTFIFLKENDLYNSIGAHCYLELSYRSYVMMNTSSGENYLKKFEDLNKPDKLKSLEVRFVEKAYTTAAGVYYKKGNYTKSKSMVQSGLIYAPDSFKLKQMLSQF